MRLSLVIGDLQEVCLRSISKLIGKYILHLSYFTRLIHRIFAGLRSSVKSAIFPSVPMQVCYMGWYGWSVSHFVCNNLRSRSSPTLRVCFQSSNLRPNSEMAINMCVWYSATTAISSWSFFLLWRSKGCLRNGFDNPLCKMLRAKIFWIIGHQED